MKNLNLILTLLFVATLSACATKQADVVVTPTPIAPQPVAPDVEKSADVPALKLIPPYASASACAGYSWKNRGKAPLAYMQGMALTFAKQVCNQDNSGVAYVSRANTGGAGDVLNNYGLKPKAGVDSLRTVYTLLMGLGMRESSGKHCEGRDVSANFTTAETAEAGLFQTSYNVVSVNAELKKLYESYKANPKNCFLETFSNGVTCSASSWNNWGIGEGVKFQELEKTCPAFATEVAAITVRFSGGPKGHYGPLRTKAAEYKIECESLLLTVQKAIEAQPELCKGLR